jgi:hypothetical protein
MHTENPLSALSAGKINQPLIPRLEWAGEFINTAIPLRDRLQVGQLILQITVKKIGSAAYDDSFLQG